MIAVLSLVALLASAAEARFGSEDCRLAQLRDGETGAAVLGAEDLTLSADGRSLFVSAYDRHRNEPGGVYRVALPLPAGQVWSAVNLAPGTRPHGIAARPGGGFTAIARSGKGEARLLTDEGGDRPLWQEEVSSDGFPLCAANDLIFTDEGEGYFTVDQDGCGGLGRFLGGRRASVRRLAEGLPAARDRLRLANGIAVWRGNVWVAEMRGRRLVRLDDGAVMELSGAPDNLNASDRGIVVALQPSLWRFGLYRYGWTDRAPTRLVLAEPEGGTEELLFADDGSFFPGATAAVLEGGVLVASSVVGSSLLVCEKRS